MSICFVLAGIYIYNGVWFLYYLANLKGNRMSSRYVCHGKQTKQMLEHLEFDLYAYVFIYIYIYIHMHTCIYIYMYTCIYIYT